MAGVTSGYWDTDKIGDFYITFSWLVKSQTATTYTIAWKLVAHNSAGSYRTVCDRYLKVNGSQVLSKTYYGDGGVQCYDGTEIASGTFTKGSTGSFTAEGSFGVGIYSGTNLSKSKTWTLPSLVSTPTVTCTLGNRGINTIAASMKVTNNGGATIQNNYIEIFTNSGCTNKVGTITGTSGTFTGLNPNTTYYIRARASNGTYTGYSSVQTTSTYDIAKISELPSEIDHGESFNIRVTNPSGANIKALIKVETETIKEITLSTGDNVISFSDAELDELYRLYGMDDQLAITVTVVSANTYETSATMIIKFKGDARTAWIIHNGTPKRGQVWIKVSNNWVKGILWKKNQNNEWKKAC